MSKTRSEFRPARRDGLDGLPFPPEPPEGGIPNRIAAAHHPKMDTLIYWPARVLVALIQALPLTLVARLGRAGGGLAFWLDARHRRVALKNLAMCFGQEKTPEEIRALARENFRRIGENYAGAI